MIRYTSPPLLYKYKVERGWGRERLGGGRRGWGKGEEAGGREKRIGGEEGEGE